ncbi:MAG TPA: DUF1800 domain-containing protein [Gemmataceae bacterium]|jgi:uncharacterized protein (DUF1800 family)|nr:DUF1800 domain-containing protein [Gemmataceae bacterium]
MARNVLPPLDKIDGTKAWQPWEPGAADPWNLKWAGHLYRRAGFGASPAELREAVKEGLPNTLKKILHVDPTKSLEWQNLLDFLGGQIASKNNTFELRGWWLYAILQSPFPLEEKMTLFWHNHFATSIAKVQRTVMMYQQNRLLRQHALGKFRPLLLEMSKDPAMLVWLDSNSNVKGRPNENYARELMELFSLGVGNYTETDIREAARAFTGWHTDDNQFEFESSQHDDGEKIVLGQKGMWNGDDIVRIVLEKPAAARFLVRKLYRYFISEKVNPPDSLLEPLADSFRQNDYDIGALVQTMLRSQHFFSDYAYKQRIKNPVEYVVGTIRLLWRKGMDERMVEPTALIPELEAMGQELFAPPNVKGWVGGKNWLNSATVLARHNFAQKVAAGQLPNSGGPNIFLGVPVPEPSQPAPKDTDSPEPISSRDASYLVTQEKITEPLGIVDRLVEMILQREISPDARGKLVAFVGEGKPEGAAKNRRIRETIHALMTMPEYQLA